jgi:hypothetical protein
MSHGGLPRRDRADRSGRPLDILLPPLPALRRRRRRPPSGAETLAETFAETFAQTFD